MRRRIRIRSHYRTFNGKRYVVAHSYTSKSIARAHAVDIREAGGLARVVPWANEWVVYYR